MLYRNGTVLIGGKLKKADIRTENGKIAEHWDVMETIAEKDTWQNQNSKF